MATITSTKESTQNNFLVFQNPALECIEISVENNRIVNHTVVKGKIVIYDIVIVKLDLTIYGVIAGDYRVKPDNDELNYNFSIHT